MAEKSKLKKEYMDLAKRLLKGDRRSLARLISMIEDNTEATFEIFEFIHEHCKECHVIGVTGPPGAGKSTIVDGLISHIRKNLNKKVGVIAVDPSSPFTGGALLGDRIRMQNHYNDEAVYIRSLSSRGHRGGLSFSARLLAKLYSGFGFDYVIIETVGVGQSEVDIMEIADTTAVILVPESGDTIQTMKAGLLEIADVFVVNKADREGADSIAEELTQMIMLENSGKKWKVPVLLTEANKEKGIEGLFDNLKKHKQRIEVDGTYTKKKQILKKREIIEIALAGYKRDLESLLDKNIKIKREIEAGKVSPFAIARQLVEKIK